MRPYASVWLPMVPYRSLCVLRDSNGSYGTLLVLIRPYGSLLVFLGLYALVWI